MGRKRRRERRPDRDTRAPARPEQAEPRRLVKAEERRKAKYSEDRKRLERRRNVIGLLGLITDQLFKFLRNRLLPWAAA